MTNSYEDVLADVQSEIVAASAAATAPVSTCQEGSLGYRIDDPARGVFNAGANSVVVTDELRATAALLDARPDRRWQPWGRR